MYAVVATSGRQYRVSPGDNIDVDRLAGEVGSTVVLNNVVMVSQGSDVKVGTPHVADARVEAKIVSHKRGPKIIIFKHKRRKGYRRKQGHRQDLTALRIIGIYTEAAAPIAETMETPEPLVAPMATSEPSSDVTTTPAPAWAPAETAPAWGTPDTPESERPDDTGA
jgi:large subunit ribosomal protein L21